MLRALLILAVCVQASALGQGCTVNTSSKDSGCAVFEERDENTLLQQKVHMHEGDGHSSSVALGDVPAPEDGQDWWLQWWDKDSAKNSSFLQDQDRNIVDAATTCSCDGCQVPSGARGPPPGCYLSREYPFLNRGNCEGVGGTFCEGPTPTPAPPVDNTPWMSLTSWRHNTAASTEAQDGTTAMSGHGVGGADKGVGGGRCGRCFQSREEQWLQEPEMSSSRHRRRMLADSRGPGIRSTTYGPWWTINLQQAYTMKKIKLLNRDYCGGGQEKAWRTTQAEDKWQGVDIYVGDGSSQPGEISNWVLCAERVRLATGTYTEVDVSDTNCRGSKLYITLPTTTNSGGSRAGTVDDECAAFPDCVTATPECQMDKARRGPWCEQARLTLCDVQVKAEQCACQGCWVNLGGSYGMTCLVDGEPGPGGGTVVMFESRCNNHGGEWCAS